MTRTRQAKTRDDFVHFLPSFHRTEIRKVMEKGSDDGNSKKRKHLLVKVSQEKRTDNLAQASRNAVAKGDVHVIIGMFVNVQHSNLQQDAKFGDKCAYKHTAKFADEKRTFSVGCCYSHSIE